jgi:hypothetical protein
MYAASVENFGDVTEPDGYKLSEISPSHHTA